MRAASVDAGKDLTAIAGGVWEMNILISEAAVGIIEGFSRRWGCGAPQYYSMKIVVTMRHLTLAFFQPERYSHLLRCYFDCGDDVLFFYEDMRAAVENRGHVDQCVISNLSKTEQLQANDSLVRGVVRFCLDHEDEILKLPPPWFPAATQISDKRTRKNFPEMADADLRRKQLFWDSLNKSINSQNCGD